MHKQLVNELRLDFVIKPQGPLLIKSGKEAGADPTLLDMNFVRTHHALLGETIYLPGSSLKGTLRSYCEKIVRTVGVNCCDPLGDRSCGRRLEHRSSRRGTAADVYRELCTACRIFGHTVMSSHVQIEDAYPLSDQVEAVNATEERDGVAIDRVSGAVAVGPFQLEVVTQGAFQTQLYLKNSQLWQVGLLAVALRDIGDGRVPLGFGKSRGLGRVKINYERLEISYPGQFGRARSLDFVHHLYGVTAFPVEGAGRYDFEPEEPMPLPSAKQPVFEWGRATQVYQEAGDLEALLKGAVSFWADYARNPRRQRREVG